MTLAIEEIKEVKPKETDVSDVIKTSTINSTESTSTPTINSDDRPKRRIKALKFLN